MLEIKLDNSAAKLVKKLANKLVNFGPATGNALGSKLDNGQGKFDNNEERAAREGGTPRRHRTKREEEGIGVSGRRTVSRP